jgi:hypothetical protein
MGKRTMGGIQEIGRCFITTRRGVRHNWPYFLRDGNWCLTAYCSWTKRGPDLTSEWFMITHLPTGMRAGDMRIDDPHKARKLAKYHQMFGAAATLSGVMRKYRALSQQQKRWITSRAAWLLPKVKP